MIKKKVISLAAIFLVLSIVLAGFASAFGVGSEYWKGNPLRISPGETKTIHLTLQNMVGSEDIRIKAFLIEGAEIAKVEEKEYLVRLGTKDTQVPVEISIPTDVELDDQYIVTLSFQTVTSGGTGTVALGTGIDTTFDVLVVEQAPIEVPEVSSEETSEKTNLNNILVILVIIVLIVIIIIVYKKIKKQNKIKTREKKS